jgi:conjugal transfer pilus assembly protein TrbC
MNALLRYWTAVLLIGPVTAAAQDTRQFVDTQLDRPASVLPEAERDELQRQSSAAIKAVDPDFLAQLQQRPGAQAEKPLPQALYFVSFSMPEAGLKQVIQEAGRLQIPATLRGLLNNDMRQTAQAVLTLVTESLVNEAPRGGVQIDPTAFRRYGIKAVPALVVTCPSGYDRIAGTLSLSQALQKVAEKGDCAATARALLAKATP